MQALRTVLLLAITIVLVAFIAINWEAVPVNFWPLADGNYLHFEWPVGFLVLLSFLGGLLPMWLVGRAAKWRLQRRIAALENSVAASSVVAPIATSTQLEAAAPPPPPPPPPTPESTL